MNYRHFPRWLERLAYFVAEACIVRTDIGQVIGTAVALNILVPQVPLWAACVLSMLDTVVILFLYKPDGQIRRIRLFETLAAFLVAAIFTTIRMALAMASAPAGEAFRGCLPSRDIFVGTGFYESCAILGGTLMPRAIYVGSSLPRVRLYDFDSKHGLLASSAESPPYRPSLRAIRSCLAYSIAELCSTLFAVAVFVNSALVVISGSVFYNRAPAHPVSEADAQDRMGSDSGTRGGGGEFGASRDLYDLYHLFSRIISPAAGLLFAASLLFSGISAGVMATMAGQLVMEGALPTPACDAMRSRHPSAIVSPSVGRPGMLQALVACNYVLAVGLIFVALPLVYYTSRERVMRVSSDDGVGTVSLRNSWPAIVVAWVVWLVVMIIDIATVALIGLGLSHDD